jgi:hypothetical protein
MSCNYGMQSQSFGSAGSNTVSDPMTADPSQINDDPDPSQACTVPQTCIFPTNLVLVVAVLLRPVVLLTYVILSISLLLDPDPGDQSVRIRADLDPNIVQTLIRIGSAFNGVPGTVSGSGFAIWIRIQGGKNGPEK